MKDVLISDDNDVELIDGDFPVVSGTNRVIQHINTALHILITDWVLDYTQGIDYITGLRGYPEIMSAQIKKAINSVEGVDTVLKYNFYEGDNNTYYVAATVKVGNSEISINNEINPQSLV
jgi:hypothetical protein